MPQVIEGEHAVEKHQHAIGNIEIVRSMYSDVLQPPHHVIRAIADRARGEGRQSFHRCRTMLLQQFLNYVENISRAAVDFMAAFDLDLGAARLQPQKRTYAKKRVPPNFFSTFDRLQQEGIGLSVRDSKKGGNRRQQVGGDRLHHRNQRGAARQPDELFVVGTDHASPHEVIMTMSLSL